MLFVVVVEKMSFDLRKELEKLNSTAPILKDRDDDSDEGNPKTHFFNQGSTKNLIFFF